jgi:cytochrome P450
MRAGSGRLVAFRNEDLRRIAANPFAGNMPFENLMRRTFIDGAQDTQTTIDERPSFKRFLVDQIFTANSPRHRPMRHVLASRIMPKQSAALAPIADQIVQELINELAGPDDVDFASQFAEQLTGRFWERAIGMSREERDRTIAAVHALTPLFFVTRTSEEIVSLEGAIGEYLDVLSAAVERSVEGNPLLLSMRREFDVLEIDDRPRNFGVWVATNVIDGFHTAAVACVNVMYCLLRAPEGAAAARADQTHLPKALVEGLRMLAPLIVSNRFALEDFEYEGIRIPAGTAIAMFWAAGNRDPDVFENPNLYNLHRNPRFQMTFGGGIHICPGRYIGSMLAAAVLKGLINPGVEIALSDDRPRWHPRSFMRQAERLMVTIKRVA